MTFGFKVCHQVYARVWLHMCSGLSTYSCWSALSVHIGQRGEKRKIEQKRLVTLTSSLLPTAKTQGLTQNTLPHMVTLCPLHPTSPPPPPSSILQSPPSTLTTRRHLTSHPNPCVCVCVCVWRVAD